MTSKIGTLRSKILMILLVQAILLCAIVIAVVDMVMLPEFERLQHKNVTDHIKRAENTVASDVLNLEQIAFDWSVWDDAYGYIQDGNAEFKASNLIPETFSNYQIDMMFYINLRGDVIYQGQMDLVNQKMVPVEPQFLEALKKRILNPLPGATVAESGLFVFQEKIMLLASHSVLPSSGQGEPKGYVVVCKRLTDSLIDQWSQKIELPLKVTSVVDNQPYERSAAHVFIENMDNHLIRGSVLLNDINLKPVLDLSLTLKKETSAVGKKTMEQIVVFLVLTISVFTGLLSWYIDKRMLFRLSQLSHDVKLTGNHIDFDFEMIHENGSDEIGVLVTEIKSMLRKIRHYQLEIIENENALRTANSTLEIAVQERTRALSDSNQRLVQEVDHKKSIEEELVGQYNALSRLALQYNEANEQLKDEIEEHQHTIKLLFESESRFKTIVQALPDVVFRLNEAGIFMDCEGGDAHQLLSDPSIFIGKHLSEILPYEITKSSLEKIKATLENNELQMLEYVLGEQEEAQYFEVRFTKASGDEVFAILRDVSEIKKKQEFIEFIGYHDQLTGLYNRRFFEEELKRLDTERNLPFSVAMLDVNGLKLTNDAFGHFAGDKLLQTIAEILKNECRSDEIVARVGGDEFVLLLPKTPAEDAKKLVDRIYAAIESLETTCVVVSASIGHDTKNSRDQFMHDVILKAEESMYRKKIKEGQVMRQETIAMILKCLFDRSNEEKSHAHNVRALSLKMGERLMMTPELLKDVEAAAFMHDIGKIAIDQGVQLNQGSISFSDYEEIKRHSEVSYQILKQVDIYAPIAEYVLAHHERWDGQGYPRGLQGEGIPIIARIISVADAFDAMTSRRPYRKTKSTDEAIKELYAQGGTQFDLAIVEILDEIIEVEDNIDTLEDSQEA